VVSGAAGSRLPGLTRQGGKHTLQRPKTRSLTVRRTRCAPPPTPHSFFACSAPPAGHSKFVCLGACIVTSTEAEKVPSGPWNHRSPRGAFTLLGPDFMLPHFSLISGSSGDKASTRSRGPVTRVTCQGNQHSLRLVPARAVACRA